MKKFLLKLRKQNRKNLDLVLLVFLCFSSPLFGQSDDENRMLTYINAERSRENLAPLKWEDDLYKVALEHSKDMARTARMSHTGSDGSQPQDRARTSGVFASSIAENVARDINVVSAHTSLMKSIGHRQNILNPEFTHAAVAIYAKDGFLYVTEMFVRRLEDYSAEEVRRLLLEQINSFRKRKGLRPLEESSRLNEVADANAELHAERNRLEPALMARPEMFHSLWASVFTTGYLEAEKIESESALTQNAQEIGIGYKRIRGPLCDLGCYLVVLMTE